MSQRVGVRRTSVAIGMVAALIIGVVSVLPGSAGAVSPDVVISQVYGGGGNTGAPFTNDFVELFNRGATPVDVSGWSVQYASATGTGNFGSNPVVPLVGTLQPGQHHLVQLAGGTAGVALPPADSSGTINMSGTSGEVVVARTSTGISCNGSAGQPCTPDQLALIVDLVGYGTANFSEGPATEALSNTTAAQRVDRCADTDDNLADLDPAAPAPRNSATPLAVCGTAGDAAPAVASSVPADGAVNVSPDLSPTVTFSEPVSLGVGAIGVACATTGDHTVTTTGGPTTFTVDPDPDFAAGESCTLTVRATGVTDQDASDPPDSMAADATVDFTVATPAPAPVAIHDIQGASHTSPRAGTEVVTLPALVTATVGNGFYLQDPAPDADDATSEAIFVFTNSSPTVAVGDLVSVRGTVTEFRPGGASSTNLTTTEITGAVVSLVSSGNPLPSATVIGSGGRAQPTEVIDDDSFASFDPASDGIDFYESLEAMRVQVTNPVATGRTNDFGEISVLPDGGAGASQRTARGGIVVRPGDFNPERVILDDAIMGPSPAVNTGDTFTAPAVGVLDYGFGNYKLYVTTPLSGVDQGLVREVTQPVGSDEVSVATFNVENLDPLDPPSKFAALAEVVVDHLRSPDIVGLEEIQDDSGPTNNGVTSAGVTLDTLVAAIATAGGPTYQYRQIDPVDGADGGEPGGNIRVGFLFRTDRGVAFVDRPGGDSTTPVTVIAGPDGPQLSASPGRVAPGDPAWNASRKPLAAEFTVRGEPYFVIVNHFNSKGGDDPLFGRDQPPELSSEVQRRQQATLLNGFVASILDADPGANVIALGDFNDFEFSAPLGILLGDDLNAMIDTLPADEQYTYVFDGNSQTLDHILVSDAVLGLAAGFDVVHVNSEFAVQTSDHDPSVLRVMARVPVTFDSLRLLTASYSNDPTVTAVLNCILTAAERLQRPALREALLAVYRIGVGFETGTRTHHAFTPAEGATLQDLSRQLS